MGRRQIGGLGGLCLTTVLMTQVCFLSGQQSLNKEVCQTLPDPVFLPAEAHPVTALASFQGSGNTWVRQVLAGATGYKTGDIYKSYGDDLYPEFTSRSDDTVVAIKTHTFQSETSKMTGYKRALVIVRHPLDALYAEFNRMYGGNKTGYADAVHLINKDGSLSWKWDVWLAHITSWVDFHRYWLKEFDGKTHIIYYNNLKKDRHPELLETIKFLGIRPNMTRLNCTIDFPKPDYFKRPNKPPPVDKYKLFRLAIGKANKAVRMFRDIVEEKFGKDHWVTKRMDMEISVKKLA